MPLWRFFTLLTLLTLALRYALVPFRGGFPQDRATLASWAQTLQTYPLTNFYGHASNADHLPGDLILLKLVQSVYALGGGTAYGESFAYFARSIPIGADVGVGMLAYSILAHFGLQARGRLIALLYAVFPMSIIMAGWWTAYDSLSVFLVLGVFRLLLSSSVWATVMAGVLTIEVLFVKPQMILILLPFMILLLQKRWIHQILFIIAGLGWSLFLCHLFGLGFIRAGPSGLLATRLTYAANRWPYAVNDAPNMWAWLSVTALDNERWHGVSLQQYGVALMLLSLIVVIVGMWKNRQDSILTILWGSIAAYSSFLIFATRVHGRYFLPTIVLLIVLHALRPHRTFIVAATVFALAFLITFTSQITSPWNYDELRACAPIVTLAYLSFLLWPFMGKIFPFLVDKE